MSALWADNSRPFGLFSPRSRGTVRPRGRRTDQHPGPRTGAADRGSERTRLGRVPFVLVLMAIFGLGMAGLLALNTTLQGQAFQATALHKQANQLTYQQASLERRVDDLRSIDSLAARAFALGLRPDPHPGFIQEPSGKVLHKATTVTGNEVPMLVKTPEEIKAKIAAKEAKAHAAEAQRQAAAARKQADQNQQQSDTGQVASGTQNTTTQSRNGQG